MNLSPEQTAAQLRCPHDEAGTAFGQMMNLRNLTQILGSFEAVQLQNGDRILETGCGNGGLLGYILSQAENLHYTGLEISPLMHAQAQAFNAPFLEAGLADYRLYDGGALPFADESFDKIVSVNTVYFLGRRTKRAFGTGPRAEIQRAAMSEFLRKRLYGETAVCRARLRALRCRRHPRPVGKPAVALHSGTAKPRLGGQQKRQSGAEGVCHSRL